MTVLYVTSAQRGAGKTAFCATLADELSRKGKRTAVFKPFGEAPQSGLDPDVVIFHRLLGQPEPERHFPVEDGRLGAGLLNDVKDAASETLEKQDILLVEGSSGISDVASRQLADSLDARVLVVAKNETGMDASDLTRWQGLFGDRLLGVAINGFTRYQGADLVSKLLPSVNSAGLNCLGAIPEDRKLLSVTAGQLASHLKGRFIMHEELADSLVEHYMVGGPGLDEGALYFGLRENKAVIVRGDRPDVQMAALQTPLSCMVLTQGIGPTEYVLNEAELEDVPIIVVESDTLSTMASLNSVQDSARFDHPAKLDRFRELLREHVDLAAIYAGLGLAA